MIRRAAIKQMIEQLREELEYEFHGDQQWLYAVSLNTEELDQIIACKDYAYVIAVKALIKMEEVDLVDGTIVEFDVEIDSNGEIQVHIDLGFTERAPLYNGGTIENAIKWLSRDSDSGGNEIVYLSMRDEKYSSYRVEEYER